MTAKATTIARSCCGTPLGERHDYNLVRDSIYSIAAEVLVLAPARARAAEEATLAEARPATQAIDTEAKQQQNLK